MSKYKIVIIFTLLWSCSEPMKPLDIENSLDRINYPIVKRLIAEGNSNFYFITMDCAGFFFEKTDSCEYYGAATYVLFKTQKHEYDNVEFNKCGKQPPKPFTSKALRFYEKNKRDIINEELEIRSVIDHTCHYSFYEIEKNYLIAYENFSLEEINIEDDIKIKNKNINTVSYEFYQLLENDF